MTKKEISQVIVNRTLPHDVNPACVFLAMKNSYNVTVMDVQEILTARYGDSISFISSETNPSVSVSFKFPDGEILTAHVEHIEPRVPTTTNSKVREYMCCYWKTKGQDGAVRYRNLKNPEVAEPLISDIPDHQFSIVHFSHVEIVAKNGGFDLNEGVDAEVLIVEFAKINITE